MYALMNVICFGRGKDGMNDKLIHLEGHWYSGVVRLNGEELDLPDSLKIALIPQCDFQTFVDSPEVICSQQKSK